jgi:glutaredoxin
MTYYCTNCWKEIKPDDKICPYCKANQNDLNKKTFTHKLIRALDHSEPATPIRAAKILGQINAKEAVPSLLKKLTNEKDPFIIEALADAILTLRPDMKSQIKILFKNNIPVTIKSILE